jgi:hypothetical protein
MIEVSRNESRPFPCTGPSAALELILICESPPVSLFLLYIIEDSLGTSIVNKVFGDMVCPASTTNTNSIPPGCVLMNTLRNKPRGVDETRTTDVGLATTKFLSKTDIVSADLIDIVGDKANLIASGNASNMQVFIAGMDGLKFIVAWG